MIDDSLIDGDNQAIMLEAARRKEENGSASGVAESDERAQIREALDSDDPDDSEGPNVVTGVKFRGDQLSNVSLEMFVQLFEMEEKTCALAVENPQKNKRGVLYFKNGDLLDAKLNYITGNKAALEILSWERVSIEIGYDMDLTEKKIDGDLQGMLLEAMRLRDEGNMAEEDFLKEDSADSLGNSFDSHNIMGNSIPTAGRNMSAPEANGTDPGAIKEGKTSEPGGFKKFWSRLTKK